MMGVSRLNQSPAMIVAIVALIAALAGTAIADPGASTSKITKSKVKKIANKQINKRLPIDAAELGAGAVTAPKLGTLTVRDSAPTTVPADGAPGNGLSQARNAEVSCNAGEVALGGGVRDVEPEVDGAQAGLTVYGERYVVTQGRPTGIRARVGNDFPSDITFRVEVLCLAG